MKIGEVFFGRNNRLCEHRKCFIVAVILVLNVCFYTKTKGTPQTSVFLNYSTLGYSIIKSTNDDLYYLTGTLYKEPIITNSSIVEDSTDIHFLVLDKDGNVVHSRVYDSEANDQSYHILEYDVQNNLFLLTTSTNGLSPNISPFFSLMTYIVVDNQGAIVTKKSYRYYEPVQLGLGLSCEFVGTRDIRPFKSVLANGQIFTCGIQKDFEYLNLGQPNDYDEFIKTGFIKCVDYDLNPIWDKIITLNDPNLPCYQQTNGSFGKDFDCLENIIDIPGYGISVAGTFSHLKQTNGEFYGTIWMVFGYNGVLLNDFSHYSTNDTYDNLSPSFQMFSPTDNLLYILENDESNRSINVVGADLVSNQISSNDYKVNFTISNPDIFLQAYSLFESIQFPEYLVVTGMAQQLAPGGIPSQDFLWTPFLFSLDKNMTQTPVIFQSGVTDNWLYTMRGDKIHQPNFSIPKTYTPEHSINSFEDGDVCNIVGYQRSANNQFGIRMVKFSNVVSGIVMADDCNLTSYETVFLQPERIMKQLDYFDIDYVDANVDFLELSAPYVIQDCQLSQRENYEVMQNSVQINISVYNLQGSLVFRTVKNANEIQSKALVDFLPSSLANGLYFLVYNSINSQITRKEKIFLNR